MIFEILNKNYIFSVLSLDHADSKVNFECCQCPTKVCYRVYAASPTEPIRNNSRRRGRSRSRSSSSSSSRRRIIGSPFGKIKYRVLVISAWLLVAAAANGWSWSELLRWLRDWHCSHAFMSSIRPANPARPGQARPSLAAYREQPGLVGPGPASSPSSASHAVFVVLVDIFVAFWMRIKLLKSEPLGISTVSASNRCQFCDAS